MAIFNAARIVVKIFIKLKLAIPFSAAVVILLLWLFDVIQPGTGWFLGLWIGLIVLTLLTIVLNIKNLRDKQRQKNNWSS